MIAKLKKLELISRQLEPTSKQRKKTRGKVISYSEKFLKQIEKLKAYNSKADKGIGLLHSPISENAISIEQVLHLLQEQVDKPGLNPASGGHLGYIPGGGIYYSALGDYLADVTNRYAGVFFASPGAVRMENMLLGWMRKIIGYPKHAAGNLTSGGSIANLIAIVTARDAHTIRSKNCTKSVIYISQQAHHSIQKAIRIAGLDECILRYVKLDSSYRMLASELENEIEKDKKKGLNPFLIIAAAGTTDVGAIDPLNEIGKIAKRNKIWFHVDAAYGGFFVLTKEGKKKLAGIEKSDSISIDPHKGLFLPYGLGAVLIKNAKQMKKSHSYLANYMQDTLRSIDELSPADLSPELSKHFRGLRLWLPLKLHGIKPFVACLEEKLLLTKYFYQEIQKLGFEVECKPELSVVTYRYIPKNGDPSLFNKKLVEEIQKDGRVFITSTMLNGKFTLRLAILAFRTHKSTIDLALKILKEKVRLLERRMK